MKLPAPLLLLALSAAALPAQSPTPPAMSSAPKPTLVSAVHDWESMPVTNVPNGIRRAVFDGPTTTVDLLHCHITTLHPGQSSGEPRLHHQEEVIVIKEGRVEVHLDGRTQEAGPGSVIFFAAGATTRLRNVGGTPATYTVIYYYTPLTPKG